MTYITDTQWSHFDTEGYLILGQVAPTEVIEGLRARIDEIMLGEASVDYARMLMQLDSSDGAYESAGEQTRGFKGPTFNYRKIEQLEADPLFLAYMQLPVFAEAARRLYGDRPVAAFRAMFMNKPAGRGTMLPLHQDHWRALDLDPLLTIYTALDAANTQNGCVTIIPRTHTRLLNPMHPSGFLTAEMARAFDNHPGRMPLLMAPGEVVLLHNWTLHESGVNRTSHSRRAFSVCLMDAATMSLRYDRPASRSIIFGDGALSPNQHLA